MTGSVRPELHEDEPTHLLRIGLLLAVAVTGLLSAAVVGLPREHSGLSPIARQALTEALPRWETTEPVSEIVYGTRAFDTFGETFLLIAAVVSVMMLTRSREPRDGYIGEEDVGKQEQREEDPHLLGVASIAGVPPLNGYASLGMIHDALRSHPGTFAAVLLAQVITIAALGRAAYLAFFRRRDDDYDPLERMRPGMLVAFCSLGAGCVAFGVMPGFVLTHVADPAAAGLTSPSVYSSAALSGAAHVTVEHAPFNYFEPSEVLLTVACLVLGLLLARWYIRRDDDPAPVAWLRRLHTGSVNDYAAYSALGLVAVLSVLLVR